MPIMDVDWSLEPPVLVDVSTVLLSLLLMLCFVFDRSSTWSPLSLLLEESQWSTVNVSFVAAALSFSFGGLDWTNGNPMALSASCRLR